MTLPPLVWKLPQTSVPDVPGATSVFEGTGSFKKFGFNSTKKETTIRTPQAEEGKGVQDLHGLLHEARCCYNCHAELSEKLYHKKDSHGPGQALNHCDSVQVIALPLLWDDHQSHVW